MSRRSLSYPASASLIPFSGAAGVSINAIYSGTATIVAGNTSVSVTITAVDRAKTFVMVTGRATNTTARGGWVRGYLSSTTNLVVEIVSSLGLDCYISYFVVELAGPVTVQYGTSVFDNTTANVVITAVDLTKTFVTCSWVTPTTSNVNFSPTATLTSTTNLRFERGAGISGTSTYVAWFVVEFTG